MTTIFFNPFSFTIEQGQPVSLLPVVGENAKQPGNLGFGECRIRVGAIDHERLNFQRDPQGDVRGIAINGADKGQHLIVRKFDRDVRRATPLGRIGLFEKFERKLARLAGGIRLFDCQDHTLLAHLASNRFEPIGRRA